jgi:hypothetical protein
MTFTAGGAYIHARHRKRRGRARAAAKEEEGHSMMRWYGHTTLIWTVLIIGLVWSVYSATSELLLQVDRLRDTLLICGNTWLIESVI